MAGWVIFVLCALASTPTTDPQAQATQQESPLTGGPFSNPVELVEEKIEEEKSEAQLRSEARQKAVEDAQEKGLARVIVLQWPNTELGPENLLIKQAVAFRISRPNAKFFPEIDLYQAGRRELDRTIRPADQRASVPDDLIPYIDGVIAQVENIPWDAISEDDWATKAEDLRNTSLEIWFVDREEVREPLFKLYAQIGRAVDHANIQLPPFWEHVGNRPVNYYWYLAAAMAYEDPALMDSLTDAELAGNVTYLKNLLDSGEIPLMTLSFEEAGIFDAKSFARDYEVFINGRETTITNKRGLIEVPPGRADVYLKRANGHSISDRIELDKLNDKIYGVRDTARQRMGKEFIEQLLKDPYICLPDIDGDIITYLSIYAKLHPEADLFVAIPLGVKPNRIFLWKWDRFNAALVTIGKAGFRFKKWKKPTKVPKLPKIPKAYRTPNMPDGLPTPQVPW